MGGKFDTSGFKEWVVERKWRHRVMFRCVVQMFGLPREITDLREVAFELEDGASLSDVIAALRDKIPSLEGPVIRPGEDRLAGLHKFNVNGQFHFDDMDFKIQSGDRIALLTPVTGG
jgi:molybdopterin converting factor small subunit